MKTWPRYCTRSTSARFLNLDDRTFNNLEMSGAIEPIPSERSASPGRLFRLADLRAYAEREGITTRDGA